MVAQRRLCLAVLGALLAVLFGGSVPAYGAACKGSKLGDKILSNSQLYGQPNASDAAWNDHTQYFQQYGPITNIMMMRAYYYDGEWHDPGEFKGLQLWYGNYSNASNPDQFLFGARKPHLQYNCTVGPGEAVVKVQLQHDRLQRYMAFTLNTGRVCSWGFLNAANTTNYLISAPNPGAYLAAIRGFEGKPLPPEKGGYKKRYIVQVSFVWAQSDCANLTNLTSIASNPTRAPAATASWDQQLASTAPGLAGQQGRPTGVPSQPPKPVAAVPKPAAAVPQPAQGKAATPAGPSTGATAGGTAQTSSAGGWAAAMNAPGSVSSTAALIASLAAIAGALLL